MASPKLKKVVFLDGMVVGIYDSNSASAKAETNVQSFDWQRWKLVEGIHDLPLIPTGLIKILVQPESAYLFPSNLEPIVSKVRIGGSPSAMTTTTFSLTARRGCSSSSES